MAFKFNPLTGELDIVNAESISSNPNIITYNAANTISAIKAVKLNNSSEVIYADNTVDDVVLGISTNGGTASNPINIQTYGEISDASLSYSLGSDIFLTNSGGLTDVPPMSEFLVKIGKIIKTNTMFIDIDLICKRN